MASYGYNVTLMKVVDGILPEGIEWRVLLALEAGQEPGIAWQMGHALARANRGDLVIAILVSPDDSKDKVNAAISTADAYREGRNGKNGADTYAVVVETRHITTSLLELVKKSDIDLAMMIASRPDQYDFRQLPCAVALLRLANPANEADREELSLIHI